MVARNRCINYYPLPATFETGILIAGHGKFQHTLFLLCGSIYACGIMSFQAMNYLLPPIQCAFGIDDTDKMMWNFISFAGSLTGCLFWGVLGDAVGRKPTLMWSLLALSLCEFVQSLVPNFSLYSVLEFLTAFSAAAPCTIVFPYVAEFVSKERRGCYVCLLLLFWCIGMVSLSGLAWLILPINWKCFYFERLAFCPWNAFHLALGIQPLVMALLLIQSPESPGFLMAKGMKDKALRVFQEVYSVNEGVPGKYFPVRDLVVPSGTTRAKGSAPSTWVRLKAIFSPPLLRHTITIVIGQATLACSFFCTTKWFTRFPGHMDTYYLDTFNNTLSLCLQHQDNLPRFRLARKDYELCLEKLLYDEAEYVPSMIIAAFSVPGILLCASFIGRIGPTIFIVVAFVVNGLMDFSILFLKNPHQGQILAWFQEAFTAIGYCGVICIVINIYPSTVRTQVIAMLMVMSRFAGLVAMYTTAVWTYVKCAYIILPMGVFTVACGIPFLIIRPISDPTLQ